MADVFDDLWKCGLLTVGGHAPDLAGVTRSPRHRCAVNQSLLRPFAIKSERGKLPGFFNVSVISLAYDKQPSSISNSLRPILWARRREGGASGVEFEPVTRGMTSTRSLSPGWSRLGG